MRIPSSVTGLAVLWAVACVAPSADSDSVDVEAEEQRVLAAEDQYVAAEIAGDEGALRRLVDDRFSFNSGDGSTSGKDELIQNVLAMNMTGQSITERSVMVEGNLGVVFGTTELRLQGPNAEERSSVFRYTSVYVRRQDDWRLLALQMAPR